MNAGMSFRAGWRVVLGAAVTLLGVAVLYLLEKRAPQISPGIFFCILMGIPVCATFVAVPSRGPNVLANHGIIGLLVTFIAIFLVASGKGAFVMSLIFSLFGMTCGLLVGLVRITMRSPEPAPGADTPADVK